MQGLLSSWSSCVRALAASVDSVGDAGGVGGDAGEARVLDVGAVLVHLGVAVLPVHDKHAAHAESVRNK